MRNWIAIACLAGAVGLAGHTTVFAQAGTDDEAGDTPPTTGSYVIGVEDVLNIVTWGEEELSGPATVRPDGMITVPLINEIRAAGMTPSQLRRQIVDKMKDYIRDPNVTVTVEQINHFKVYFLGEIRTQGTIQFQRPVRLLQAIAEAGGLTEFSKKNITVLREEHGVEKRIEIDYKKLWSGDPAQENLYLKPGDTVLVK
jgi:polysaccharide export outer membrane protein